MLYGMVARSIAGPCGSVRRSASRRGGRARTGPPGCGTRGGDLAWLAARLRGRNSVCSDLAPGVWQLGLRSSLKVVGVPEPQAEPLGNHDYTTQAWMELSARLEEKSERATMWCRQDPEAEPGCPPAFQASAGLATAALYLHASGIHAAWLASTLAGDHVSATPEAHGASATRH